jgi:hypothetical protein
MIEQSRPGLGDGLDTHSSKDPQRSRESRIKSLQDRLEALREQSKRSKYELFGSILALIWRIPVAIFFFLIVTCGNQGYVMRREYKIMANMQFKHVAQHVHAIKRTRTVAKKLKEIRLQASATGLESGGLSLLEDKAAREGALSEVER